MEVNKFVVACFKKDMYLLRPCIASIRYWYPDAEVYLLKDYMHGDFDTSEIEKNFNAKIFPTNMKYFGWPWSKLAVVLHEKKDKFLFLDSDIVLLGRVLDELNKYKEADFIVTGVRDDNPNSNNVNYNYIQMDKIATLDNGYAYPGFCFNGGQIVMTSGMLNKQDFLPAVTFEPVITNNYPEIFKHGDQGALNYVFAKKHTENKIKLQYADFWIWPGNSEALEIDLSSIKSKRGIPYVLHWAGIKPVDYRNFLRYDILEFYESEYYNNIPGGTFKRKIRTFVRNVITKTKILSYQIRGMKYEN